MIILIFFRPIEALYIKEFNFLIFKLCINLEKKENRSNFSDYVLLRNMLRADPESVILTLVDLPTDFSIDRLEKEENIDLLDSAVKLLIANSCEPKQDSDLVLPSICTDCNTYHIHGVEVNSLKVFEHCQLEVDVFLIRKDY